MRRVGVFCGTSCGVRAVYVEAAEALAHALLRRGLGMVYAWARTLTPCPSLP
jgi:predicted Rossmann-fold nucleotide-binding protein